MQPAQQQNNWRILLTALAIAAVFFSLTGCDFLENAAAADADAATDAQGEIDAGPQPTVHVGGTSDSGDGFVDWAAGDFHPNIIRGPQGGQHIWIAARMQNLWPKKMRMAIELFDAATGELVKPGKVEITITFNPDGDWLAYSGMPAFVKEPCKIKDHKLRAHLTLNDLYGVTTSADAFITPKWDGFCAP